MLPCVLILSLLTILLIRLTAGYVIYVFYALAIAAFVGFGVFMAVPSPAGQNTFILKKNSIVAYIIAFLSFVAAIIILLIFCNYK
jgi:hypothetical protein